MPQPKRRAKPKKVRTRIPKYQVHCGDAWRMFTYGTWWKLTHLTEKLNDFLRGIEFTPGLVLRDEKGHLWKPVLQVHLVPADETPEDPNG